MQYNELNNIIETERLLLREINFDDVDLIVEYCNDPDISKYMYLPYPYSREDAINWINKHKEDYKNDKLYTFGIVLKETNLLVGAISLSNKKEDQNGEIGYWIGKKHWSNGYASEAMKAIIEFAFKVKNYHRIFARCIAENIASSKVMMKNGLTYEGRLKDHVYRYGRFFDMLYFGLINSN